MSSDNFDDNSISNNIDISFNIQLSQEDTYIATEGYAFYTDEYQISDNESLILSRQNEKLFQNSTETQIFATNGF